MSLDTASRNAVRDHLDIDERIEHTEGLMQLLTDLSEKVGKALVEVSKLDEASPAPETAAYIAGLLGPSRRHTDGDSEVANLLAQAQDRAVLLARANGASWDKIGSYVDEIGENLRMRYKRKEN